jgi:hypothetical protein
LLGNDADLLRHIGFKFRSVRRGNLQVNDAG